MVDKKGMKFLHPCSELVPPVALEEFARCKEQKLVITSQLFLSLNSTGRLDSIAHPPSVIDQVRSACS